MAAREPVTDNGRMLDVNALKAEDLQGLSKSAMAEFAAALLAQLAAQGEQLSARDAAIAAKDDYIARRDREIKFKDAKIERITFELARLTDGAGAVVEQTRYEPYGQQVNRPMTDGVGYTGHMTDASSGLVYAQQRYYDPGLGLFLSIDPVQADAGTAANFNRYAYGNNNPLRFKDPDGRQGCDIPKGSIARTCLDLAFLGSGYTASTGAKGETAAAPAPMGAVGAPNGPIASDQDIDDALAKLDEFLMSMGPPGMLPSVPVKAMAIPGRFAKLTGAAKETKLLAGPTTRAKEALQTPATIIVDSRGNAIPLKQGEYLSGSKNGQWVQVRDANGNVTGMRIDGAHSPKTHTDSRALQPHAHVPGVTNADGTPWLPIK